MIIETSGERADHSCGGGGGGGGRGGRTGLDFHAYCFSYSGVFFL